MQTQFEAFHPGQVLEEELDERNLDYKAFAESIELPFKILIQILGMRENITEEIAGKLERELGVSKEFWMNMQHDYDKQNEQSRRT